MSYTEVKEYEPLTEKTAVTLAKSLGLFSNEILMCNEIGDGNLNLVFHIKDQESQKGIIIKQALPYAKVVGESWPLTLQRSQIEANALKQHGAIVPHFVPEVFYQDELLAITVMEDLSYLRIVRNGLIEGERYPLLADHIGEYLAKTLFYTSEFALPPSKKKEFAKQFSNPELCRITEELVFTDPFFDSESNDFEEELYDEIQSIWQDSLLKLEAAKLKRKFLTEAEALLHGDLHTGSIFANQLETKVIDPEFAFYGPFGFDVGQFFANLIFQAITGNEEKRDFILQQIQQTWKSFVNHFTHAWLHHNIDNFAEVPGFLDSILNKIFEDSIGFAGCELIRRTIGLSHVKDLEGIADKDERIQNKKAALTIGKTCILEHSRVDSIQQFIVLLQEALTGEAKK
ncbi:S-methyl-5-thioribose kinase [Heyndrickxia acidicola]|uniref:Methylthioribose kinase n=1 Tax=Heyndrickxia acidicola TaxID=209389 RepID=A0ABU6MIF0_9BACI|nr:S-methyl-5-thioribose kinase [Heyndrickxia acidicola]MED1204290.1 S-methyl-5-thioribose kinase [Heyndrickxia acidicola]